MRRPPLRDEELYARLRALIAEMPDLSARTSELHKWLGYAAVLVEEAGVLGDGARFRMLVEQLVKEPFSLDFLGGAADQIPVVLYRAFAAVELRMPTNVQGSFIPAERPFDAMVTIAKICETATRDLLAIDPYADHVLLQDFLVTAPEGISLRVLAARKKVKDTLRPAVDRWIAQHGSARPLQVRLSPERALHDRFIIIDGAVVWDVKQSFAQLAARSHTSVEREGSEVAKLTIEAFEEHWETATVFS